MTNSYTGVRLDDAQSTAVMTCLAEKNVTILATMPDLIVGKCEDHTLVIKLVGGSSQFNQSPGDDDQSTGSDYAEFIDMGLTQECTMGA